MRSRNLILSIIVLLLTVACQEKAVTDNNGISIKTTEADNTASSQWLKVVADGDWELVLHSDDCDLTADDAWVWLKQYSGHGSASVLLSWEANKADQSRACTITLATAGKEYTCYFVQRGNISSSQVSTSSFASDPVAKWMELPVVGIDSKHFYVTHDMTVSGKTVRNYSFLLDIDAKVSNWVAYPLNKGLIGSGSRHFSGTSFWADTMDPKVPREYQALTENPFRGLWGINRGHQIPSADRLSDKANFQTFYGTNMTPQDGAFNSNAWADLEGKVRSWASSFDTLYVVTGADVRGVKEYASDDAGKKIAKPVGYYKALLGYRRNGTFGITATTGGYTAIGFYFENDDYNGAIMDASMTISQLEKKMGIDFFVNLPSATAKADYVESTRDSWWK